MGIYAQNTKQTEQSYRPELNVVKKAYPVYLHSDTLFYIDTNFAILTAEERADNISKRLHKIYKEADSIRIEKYHTDNSIELSCCESFIMTVVETDTIGKNMQLEELADFYSEKITTSFYKIKKDRNIWIIILRIFLVILVIGMIWVILKLINRGYTLLYRLIVEKQDQFLRDLSYKDYTFMTASQELKIVVTFLQVFRWIVVILLIYMLLPILFSILPFSRGWATALFEIYGILLNLCLFLFGITYLIYSLLLLYTSI